MSNKMKSSSEPKSHGLTPKLRFPEFRDAGEWERKRIGDEDFACLYKGKGISKSDIDLNGETPCIRYGELYTRYTEIIDVVFSKTNYPISDLFLSRKNDVIIPASGETKIDIATASCVMHDNVALGGDLNVIRSHHNGVFLSYYLNGPQKSETAKIAQGDSVVHLYLSQLEKLEIVIPKEPEQKKIADCLSSIDEFISAQGQKLDALKTHKKGLMQQLFPVEGETVPKLRFPEFSGEWEEKKLGDIGKFKSGVGFSNSEQGGKSGIPFYKVSDMNLAGNKQTMTQSNNFVLDEQIQRLKYKPITSLAIIFAKVGAAIFLERKRVATNFLIDNNMMAFIPSANVAFLKYVFDMTRLSKFAQTGALPSYNGSDLATIKITIPKNPEEQQKITDCLSSIDEFIAAQGQKLDALKTHKKGLMQQLFPSADDISEGA